MADIFHGNCQPTVRKFPVHRYISRIYLLIINIIFVNKRRIIIDKWPVVL